MVGKKNHYQQLRRIGERIQPYVIRKIKGLVASVALATSVLFIGGQGIIRAEERSLSVSEQPRYKPVEHVVPGIIDGKKPDLPEGYRIIRPSLSTEQLPPGYVWGAIHIVPGIVIGPAPSSLGSGHDRSTPDQPKPAQPKPESSKPEKPKPAQPKPEPPKPEKPKPAQPKPEEPQQGKSEEPAVVVPAVDQATTDKSKPTGQVVVPTSAEETPKAQEESSSAPAEGSPKRLPQTGENGKELLAVASLMAASLLMRSKRKED